MVSFTPTELFTTLKPLLLFTFGMVVYAIFIFKFYRFIAERDIFKLNLQQYSKAKHPALQATFGFLLYCLEYLFLFPLFLIFWVAVFTVLLTALSKEQTVQNIVLISIAIVAAVRVTAYYKENLSKDMAKMLPFALLGIFLVDISFFNAFRLLEIFKQTPTLWKPIVSYLAFVIALEFFLRITHGIVSLFKAEKSE